jgi:hypothetical protein
VFAIVHDQMIDRVSMIMSFLLTWGIHTHVVICELCLLACFGVQSRLERPDLFVIDFTTPQAEIWC